MDTSFVPESIVLSAKNFTLASTLFPYFDLGNRRGGAVIVVVIPVATPSLVHGP
jgi:hypothetical protein